MKFSQMEYKRPDDKALIAQYAQLCRDVENAADGAAVLQAFNSHRKLEEDFETASCLASIRHTLDTTDEFYDAENNFFDNAGPVVGNAQLEFYRAILASKHKDALAKEYGEILLDKMQISVSSANDSILDLMKEENELVSRYQKLYATCTVDFDGKKLAIPEMGPYKESMDRSLRKAAFEAEGKAFDGIQAELDEIYTRMIENRNEQARKLGFENYVPLSYLRMGRLGYDAKDVKSFRDQVARDVTPLAHKAMQAQFKRVGLADPKFYDCTVSFADGNAAPIGTAEELLDFAKKMYHELSPETHQFIDFMTESEMFDLKSRPGKAPGGYECPIPGYKAPFIFSNFNGTTGDVDVLTHEAGHAFQAWTAFNQGLCQELASPGLESCEIHSMSMEFLTAPWHHLFFGENEHLTAKYSLSHAQEALTFLPYGCMVDEFQHEVYAAQPQMTPQERNALWLRLEQKYRPWNDFEDLPFYGRGAGWQRQLHIYQHPFYYIDYCLAQMVALQFFAAQLKDPADAWKRYMALVERGGRETYAGLVKTAGFAVPFEAGAIGPVVNEVARWVEETGKKL